MQAVLQNQQVQRPKRADDGTFALYKHFSNFMLYAEPNPFRFMAMVLSHLSSVQSAVGAESFNTGIVKHSPIAQK
jgi:hypothetical protein